MQMAKGRFISRSLARDREFNAMTKPAMLLYLMAVPHLDRDGLITGEPCLLWAEICPWQPEYMQHLDEIVAQWVAAGLVVLYHTDREEPVLHFRGFRKNQSGLKYVREAPSAYPAPPEWQRDAGGLVAPVQDEVRTKSGPTPAVVRQATTPSTSTSVSRSSSIITPPASHPADQLAATATEQPPTATESTRAPAVQVVDVETAAAVTAVRPAVFDRLQKEWMTANPTQVINHTALAEKYGYADWLQGFNSTKPGARSRPAYVEKVIISEIERLAGPEESGRVNYGAGASLNALDRVLEKKRNLEAMDAARNDSSDAVRQLPEHASVGGNGGSIPAAAGEARPRIFGVGGAMAGGERGGQGAAQHRQDQPGGEGA